MILIGIETSCDETAAAVVRDGKEILSSVVDSQVKIHHDYGGVVPELASRRHVESILPVVQKTLSRSGLKVEDLDGVAVTQGPGLLGSLLVGFSFAKGLALSLNIPFVAVNHLEGHVNSVFLHSDHPQFPFVALLVSGGHTNIYYVTSHYDYELMGQTRDDAVGEAYDKVSKMLGLGYPGGAVLEALAENGNSSLVVFKRPFLDKNGFDFSFSGIKSAVNRYLKNSPASSFEEKAHVAAGFQEAVLDVLSHKIVNAAVVKNCKSIAVVGGVAANKKLEEMIREKSFKENIAVYVPTPDLCGDNAAMIASIGYHYLLRTRVSSMRADVFSRFSEN